MLQSPDINIWKKHKLKFAFNVTVAAVCGSLQGLQSLY